MLAEPQFSVAVLFVLVPHVWAESARQMLPATIAREQVGTKAGSAQIVQPPRVAEESDTRSRCSTRPSGRRRGRSSRRNRCCRW